MMKCVMSLVLAAFICVFPVCKGYCGDFAEEFMKGYWIGEMINNGIRAKKFNRGHQKQDIFVDKQYDFSRIRNMLVDINCRRSVMDAYIARGYLNSIESKLAKKASVRLTTFGSIDNMLARTYPNYMYLSDMEKTNIIGDYVYNNVDAVLTVYVYEYEDNDSDSNVSVTYNIKDKYGRVIFNDDDDRLAVRNDNRFLLLDRTVDKFVGEFSKAVSADK